MPSRPFPFRVVFAAMAIGCLARLAFGLGYWVDQPLNRDEVEYLSLARSLAAGRGYVYDDHVLRGPIEPFGRAPGYPAFLALVGGGQTVTTSTPASVKVAQSIVGALGIGLMALLAFRIGDDRTARAAALMSALHPPLIWISGFAFSEALFWPLGLCLALAFGRMLERPGARIWPVAVLVGMLTGATVLVRAATLLFVPLAGGWLLWKRQLAPLVGFVLGLLIVFGPWTARNVAHHGRFVFIASDGGVTFWTGNNALATGEGDMAANPQLKFASLALKARYPGLTEEQMEPVYYREAFSWMAAHPLDWLSLMAKKAFYTVIPVGPSYTLHSTRYYVVTVVSLAVLWPLAAIGLGRLRTNVKRIPGLWLLVAAAVMTCLVFFPQERFRIPVGDPALILLASGAWFARRPHRGA